MKKNLKKIIAAFLAATIFCSVTTVDAYALTRRLYGDVTLMQEVLAGKIDGFPVGDYFMY